MSSPTNWAQHQDIPPRVVILLSTYNGATYLPPQLESLQAQIHTNWVLLWRDDGSADATIDLLCAFAATLEADRCVRIHGPPGRIGPAASFMTLLRAAAPLLGPADAIAFADQDDVWLPEKLSRGVTALTASDAELPVLYCARLAVVDAALKHLSETMVVADRCGFPASLTQNIAVGCTVMLNRRAAVMVAGTTPPPASMHDWWCYLLVSAAGGRIVVDDAVVALYRQHGINVIGAPHSTTRRALAALRRGRGAFVHVMRQHLAALMARPELMCDTARPIALQLQQALQGGYRRRVAALRLPGLRRQNWLETALFRLWFLFG